jgi:hypothetical protein
MLCNVCLVLSALLRFCLSAESISGAGSNDQKPPTFGLGGRGGAGSFDRDAFIESLVSNMTIEDLGVSS